MSENPRQSTRISLIITTVTWILMLLPALGALGLAPSTIQGQTALTDLQRFNLYFFAALAALGIFGGWWMFSREQYRYALWLALTPLLSVILGFFI